MTPATLFPVEPTPGGSPARGPAPGSPEPRVRGPSLPVRTALARPDGPAAWFDWSANPYRGCASACGGASGSVAREWLGPGDAGDSRPRIHVKRGFAEALRRDLRTRVRPGEHVAFGTVTDPYQPVEREECVMRGALRELSRASGLRVSVTTRSALVARDVDLLLAVAERNAVHVNVTIATPDARLARFLEPDAPPTTARLETLRTLRRAGLRAGVLLMPVLPGITDGDADLRALVAGAAEAGALHVAHRVVVLGGPARARFLSALRRAYPRAAARHEVWTRTAPILPRDVPAEVAARVRAFVRASGIARPAGSGTGGRSGDPPPPVHASQRTFAFAAPPGRVA